MFCGKKWDGLKSVVKIECERNFKATFIVEMGINY
jgi:hypothetical protein